MTMFGCDNRTVFSLTVHSQEFTRRVTCWQSPMVEIVDTIKVVYMYRSILARSVSLAIWQRDKVYPPWTTLILEKNDTTNERNWGVPHTDHPKMK